MNQQQLATLEFIFACNELLSNQYDGKIHFIDDLKLKGKVILTLISLLEGTQNLQSTINLMKGSLDIPLILQNLITCHRLIQNPNLILERLKTDFYNKDLQVFLQTKEFNENELKEKSKRRLEKLGMQYYFLCKLS